MDTDRTSVKSGRKLQQRTPNGNKPAERERLREQLVEVLEHLRIRVPAASDDECAIVGVRLFNRKSGRRRLHTKKDVGILADEFADGIVTGVLLRLDWDHCHLIEHAESLAKAQALLDADEIDLFSHAESQFREDVGLIAGEEEEQEDDKTDVGKPLTSDHNIEELAEVEEQRRPKRTKTRSNRKTKKKTTKEDFPRRGTRAFLLGAILPDPEESIEEADLRIRAAFVLAAMSWRAGVSPTGEVEEGSDAVLPSNLVQGLADDAGISDSELAVALAKLRDDQEIEYLVGAGAFRVVQEAVKRRWKAGQRFNVPGWILQRKRFTYQDREGETRVLRRSARVTLVTGWFGIDSHQEPIANEQLEDCLAIPLGTIRAMLPKLHRAGLTVHAASTPHLEGQVKGRRAVMRDR